MLIVDCVLDSSGWSPIHHLVAITARLLDAKVVVADAKEPGLFAKMSSLVGRRDRDGGHETCLFVCRGPADLIRLLTIDAWRTRFKFLAAWVIDSYWLQYIPRSTRATQPFDHIFITSLEDVDDWRRMTGTATTWLPWGTDALDLGSDRAQRAWDITRVGRQPLEWQDDASSQAAAARLGLRYRGRVPGHELTALQNQRLMMQEVYADSKFVMAFSNAANPERYTHPVRQYLTGRWLDSLACGAVVAGIAPRSPDTDRLLWPGATVELGSISRQEGLEAIAHALNRWTPQIAALNHTMALEKLDWRWRLETLASVLQLQSPGLRTELERLRVRLAQRRGATLVPEPRDSEAEQSAHTNE